MRNTETEISSLWAEVDSLKVNIEQLEARVRLIENRFDTLDSSWWMRIWWRIDGWPPWYRVAKKRVWRPWHRTN